MKRLTGRAPDGTAYLYNMGGTNAAIDRLAAYEDTVAPDELEYIARAKRGERMVTDEELRRAGVSQAEIDRLFEIAVAESEGRLLVLPCKIDTHLCQRMSENQTINRKALLESLEMCVNGNDCEGCVHAGESVCIMRLMRDALAELKGLDHFSDMVFRTVFDDDEEGT